MLRMGALPDSDGLMAYQAAIGRRGVVRTPNRRGLNRVGFSGKAVSGVIRGSVLAEAYRLYGRGGTVIRLIVRSRGLGGPDFCDVNGCFLMLRAGGTRRDS